MEKYKSELDFLRKMNGTKLSNSKFWKAYSKKTDEDLKRYGFDRLRTGDIEIATSYGVFAPQMVGKNLIIDNLIDKILSKLFNRQITYFSNILLGKKNINKINNYIKDLWNINNVMLFECVRNKYPNEIDNILEEDIEPRALDWIPYNGKFISAGIIFKLLHFSIINEYFSNAKTFIEIGSGIGYLPFIIKKIKPEAKIIIVDLPEQLSAAYSFLDKKFPGKVAPFSSFKNNLSDSLILKSELSIFLVPANQFSKLNLSADVAIGTASFQEMDKSTVVDYMNKLNNCIRDGFFIYGSDKFKSHFRIDVDLKKIYLKYLSNFYEEYHGEAYFSKDLSGSFLNYSYKPLVIKRLTLKKKVSN